jgi:hypothetical protein
MDDIDEHLFMLIRLKGDDNREISLLVMPMLTTPNPAGLIKNNFNAVFDLISVSFISVLFTKIFIIMGQNEGHFVFFFSKFYF